MKISEIDKKLYEETWIDGKKQTVNNASEARKMDKGYGVYVEHDSDSDMWEVIGTESGFVYEHSTDDNEASELAATLNASLKESRSRKRNK